MQAAPPALPLRLHSEERGRHPAGLAAHAVQVHLPPGHDEHRLLPPQTRPESNAYRLQTVPTCEFAQPRHQQRFPSASSPKVGGLRLPLMRRQRRFIPVRNIWCGCDLRCYLRFVLNLGPDRPVGPPAVLACAPHLGPIAMQLFLHFAQEVFLGEVYRRLTR